MHSIDRSSPGRSRALRRAVRRSATVLAFAALVAHAPADASGPARVQLSSVDGTNGFRIDGVDRLDRVGSEVAIVPDFNGDGVADLVVGGGAVEHGGLTDPGVVWIVYGSDEPFPAIFDPAELNGSNGLAILGADSFDSIGDDLAGGDWNADGLADLVVASPYDAIDGLSQVGRLWLVFGESDPTLAEIDLATLTPPAGISVDGRQEYSNFGSVLASAGDLNADGVEDLLVSAWSHDLAGAENAGLSFVFYGRPAGGPAPIPARTLIPGVDANDYMGVAAGGGDLNGDGVDDLALAAGSADGPAGLSAGEVHVIFGRSEMPEQIDLATLDGENGFLLTGVEANGLAGTHLAIIPDLNDDGRADLAISAPRVGYGEIYILYGRDVTDPFPAVLSLADLDGTNGFTLVGSETTVKIDRPTRAGDTNGDGIEDLLLSSLFASPRGVPSAGEAYVVYGRSSTDPFPATLSIDALDGSNGFILEGEGFLDQAGLALGGGGDINDDGYDDIVVGAGTEIDGEPSAGTAYVIFGRP